MANITLKSGQKISPDPMGQGPGLLGRLGAAGLRGLEAPGRALDSVLSLLGEPATMKGSFAQDFQNYLGVTDPSQLKPQGFLESAGQRFLEHAPLSAIFGPQVLGRTAIGSLGGAAAERAGLPEWAQEVAQLGTEVGLGFLPKGALKGIPGAQSLTGEIPTLGRAQKAAQKSLEEIPTSPAVAQPLYEAIHSVEKGLGTEVRDTVRNSVQKALEVIKENVFQDKIDPQSAVKLRHKLYKMGDKLDISDAAEYISPLTQGINEFFAHYGAENPSFLSALNSRDRLTELRNMKTYVDKFSQAIPGLNKILSPILGSTLGQAERFLRGIAGNTEALKYYGGVVLGAIENDPSLLLKNLQDLLIEKGDRKKAMELFNFNPQQQTQGDPARFKIVSGGKRL